MSQRHRSTPSYDNHFTISNIPFGVVSTAENPKPQIATRLYGDVFVIPRLVEEGFLGDLDAEVHAALLESTLNHFASLGRATHRDIRNRLQDLLRTWPTPSSSHDQSYTNGDNSSPNNTDSSHNSLRSCSTPHNLTTSHLPVHPGDFSDFSCSKNHVLNAGHAVLGQRVLPPGFLHFPVGYTGRCSSIIPSGTVIKRPLGQFRDRETGEVRFGASRAVDFELEVACVVGKGSRFGEGVRIQETDEHVFGLVLMNDWSARDIQGLEMNPLGPFNGKSFGTTISPWIITLDALEPHSCPSEPKDSSITLASYLVDSKEKNHYDVTLQVILDLPEPNPSSDSHTSKLTSPSTSSSTSTILCTSNLKDTYWTIRDMLAHQTVNGCSLRPGDLLATGTVSGEEDGTHGCLLEITRGGKQSVTLTGGDGGEGGQDEQGKTKTRTYLEDGDGVELTGWAGKLGSEGCVGFGGCYGVLVGQ